MTICWPGMGWGDADTRFTAERGELELKPRLPADLPRMSARWVGVGTDRMSAFAGILEWWERQTPLCPMKNSQKNPETEA